MNKNKRKLDKALHAITFFTLIGTAAYILFTFKLTAHAEEEYEEINTEEITVVESKEYSQENITPDCTNVETTYNSEITSYTEEDIELLANIMYFEEGCFMNDKKGEYVLKLAGSVVLHRVNSDIYPDSIHDVLYQKGQYPTSKKFGTKVIPVIIYEWAESLLRDGPIGPNNLLYQSRAKQGEVYYEYEGEYFCLRK